MTSPRARFVADGKRLRSAQGVRFAALVRHKGRVLSRADLLREVWATRREVRAGPSRRIRGMRERLGDPQAPRYIVTVRRADIAWAPSDSGSSQPQRGSNLIAF